MKLRDRDILLIFLLISLPMIIMTGFIIILEAFALM